jgi:hypothetical protein
MALRYCSSAGLIAPIVLAAAVLGCGTDEPPLSNSWLVLHKDHRGRIALDTSKLASGGDSNAIYVRYDFTDNLPLPGGNGQYRTVETVEIPECAAETARVRSAVLFDSVHKEVGRIPTILVDSLPPQHSIGVAGPSLCRYLRRRGRV